MAREFYPDDQIIYDVILEANTRRSGLEFLYSPAPGLLQAMDARRSLDFAMGEKPIEVALAPTLSINNVSFTQAIELAVSPNFNRWAEAGKKSPRNSWYGGSNLDLANLNHLKERYVEGNG